MVCEAGQAGEEKPLTTLPLEGNILIDIQQLGDLIEDHLLDYFSDADVKGIALSQGEARYIVGGILRRAKPYLQNRDILGKN